MKAKLKVLCMTLYPLEGASARYRVCQFLPHLRAAGIEAEFRPFMNSPFFSRFYESGGTLRKAIGLLGCSLRRCSDLGRAARCDVVFIQKGAHFGPPLIERLIAQAIRRPIVFDFDDAVHVASPNPAHARLAGLLKYPQRTPQVLRLSRAVIVGNRYLEEYAMTLNSNVTHIPTVVDADIVKPMRPGSQTNESISAHSRNGKIVLGWLGSSTTYPYLESLFPVLQEVARHYPILLRVVGAGREAVIPGVEVDNRRWSLATELADLQSFDIGLYPLLRNNFSLGKSGFKAVQYMAVGIPAICSPVGATCDIVQDGVHGFLPDDSDAWKKRLCQLIEDAALRQHLGQAGRARVEEWFCVARQAPRLQAVLEQAVR